MTSRYSDDVTLVTHQRCPTHNLIAWRIIFFDAGDHPLVFHNVLHPPKDPAILYNWQNNELQKQEIVCKTLKCVSCQPIGLER